MNQMSFTIVNNTICPDWYLNLGPLDLQSNTLPLCHRGCWQLVLITLVVLFNDSFAISQTAYLFITGLGVDGRNLSDSIAVLKASSYGFSFSIQSSGIGVQFTIVSW